MSQKIVQTGSACLVLLLLVPATTRGQDKDPPADRDAEAAPLSVAPLEHVVYPGSRPQWVASLPDPDEEPHRLVVVSMPWDTPEECTEELAFLVRGEIENYFRRLPGADGQSDFYPITDEWIEENLITRRYEGQVDHEGMTQYEHAVELYFDEDIRAEVAASAKNAEVGKRLGAVGMLVFLGLIGLICSSTVVGAISRRVERRDAVRMSAS